MASFPGHIIGPLMTFLGLFGGAFVGYGVMKATVKDLQVEVVKLSGLASVVVGLQVANAHVKATQQAQLVKFDELTKLVYALQVLVAGIRPSGHSAR